MVVVPVGDKFTVKHCHGKDKGKTIKKFDTKGEANAMHRAIMANKKKSAENEIRKSIRGK